MEKVDIAQQHGKKVDMAQQRGKSKHSRAAWKKDIMEQRG